MVLKGNKYFLNIIASSYYLFVALNKLQQFI